MEDEFWDFYWEARLQSMENLGKRTAIQAASRLIRDISQQVDHPIRLLELGCGEGQVIGELLEAHFQVVDQVNSLGVDYNSKSLAKCRKDYPGFHIEEADFTDPAYLINIGQFDIILLVNVLHEVFSNEYSSEAGEVDVLLAKKCVEQVLSGTTNCIAPGGWLVLFDGLEPSGNPDQMVQVHFLDPQAHAAFIIFAQQYHPFHISFTQENNPLNIQISQRDFTRYITKSIFLNKPLWQTERKESYQYYSEQEFRSVLERLGLSIFELRKLTMNEEKWRSWVEIISPGFDFPAEHILILAKQNP